MAAGSATWSALGVDERHGRVARAAETLRRGGLVVAPTDTVYGLFASAVEPAAVARLDELLPAPPDRAADRAAGDVPGDTRGSGAGGPLDDPPRPAFTLHAGSRRAAFEGFELPTPVHRRLISALLPGPVRVLLEQPAGVIAEALSARGVAGGVVDRDGWVAVRVPRSRTFEMLAGAAAVPLVGRRLARPGWLERREPGPGRDGFEALGAVPLAGERAGEAGADDIIDTGPLRPGVAAGTLVLSRSGAFRVVGGGTLTEAEAMGTLTVRVLFVCTGNTCRSPMAEAIGRSLAAELPPGVSFEFASAGLAASAASPASPEAVAAVARWGIDLSRHGSKALTASALREADTVFTMTPGHLDAVVAMDAEAASKASLLDPEGGAIDDPIGGPPELYERVAERLRELIGRRLASLLGSSSGRPPVLGGGSGQEQDT